MLCSDILRVVSGKLEDEIATSRRWPWELGIDYSLMDSLNGAIREIVTQRPDATATTEVLAFGQGMRHRIPNKADGASRNAVSLINIIRNMGEDGATAGRPVFRVELDAIRTANGWNGTTAKRIQNWAYSPLDHREEFWVYPAIAEDTTLYLEMTYSAEPELVTSSSREFPLADCFANATINYILADVLMGDSSENSSAKAQAFLTMFANNLGVKLQTDIAFPIRHQGANYGAA